MFQLDPSARISPLADIERSVRGTLIEVGAHSVIDSFVKIKTAGGSGDLLIGKHCYINSGSVIYTGNGVKIGDNVLIAANCTLAATNHATSDLTLPIRLQGFSTSKGGIIIGNDVWIGANSVLLDGTVIGEGSVVGAGSVVMGKVAPYTVVVGTPARFIKRRG